MQYAVLAEAERGMRSSRGATSSGKARSVGLDTFTISTVVRMTPQRSCPDFSPKLQGLTWRQERTEAAADVTRAWMVAAEPHPLDGLSTEFDPRL